MERKIPVGINLLVLFSMNFVYFGAFAQNADDLYRKLRKSPSQDKELTDQVQADTIDRNRLDQLNQQTENYRKQDAEIDKHLAAEPALPPDNEKEDAPADSKPQSARAIAPGSPQLKGMNGSGTVAPAPNNISADNPKVAFDPMPDEITFPGDDESASKPTPKPASAPKKRR